MVREGKANGEIILIFLIIALGAGSISGCASAPSRPLTSFSPAAGEKAARTAVSMIGRPYRYRGDGPEGFDCSGLVRYSYLTAGVDVPHGTEILLKVTSPLSMSSARIGDLLFLKRMEKNTRTSASISATISLSTLPPRAGRSKKTASGTLIGRNPFSKSEGSINFFSWRSFPAPCRIPCP